MSEENQLQGCAITGVGSYVPERVLTNADLEKIVDTTDERIITRIPRMSYEVLKLERQNQLTAIAGFGARVIDWMADVELSQALLQVKMG